MQVDKKNKRKGFGEATFVKQLKKINQIFKRDQIGYVVHGNEASFNMCTKLGGEWIGNYSRIGVNKTGIENAEMIPYDWKSVVTN